MMIKEPRFRPEVGQNAKLAKSFNQFNKLLGELRKKNLSEELINSINQIIDRIDAARAPDKALIKIIGKAQSSILELIEKELNLVTKNHYRNYWMVLGMTVFGLPFGAIFGMLIDNISLLGIGLPIGMVIGMAYGAGLDKKAYEEGRQLDLEIDK